MANIKISQLPSASVVTADDFIPMVDSGSSQTQQVNFSTILNFVTSSKFETLEVGLLTVQEYHSELISASIIYESGSSLFGNSADDVHTFNGNMELYYGTYLGDGTDLFNLRIGEEDYDDGLYLDFSSSTKVSTAIDVINELLKKMAPPPAPDLSNAERNVTGSVSVKLSFGSSAPISGYTNVTASLSGLPNTNIGGEFVRIDGPGENPVRLGAFSVPEEFILILNNHVQENKNNDFLNYRQKSYRTADDSPIPDYTAYSIIANGTEFSPVANVLTNAAFDQNNFVLAEAQKGKFSFTGNDIDSFYHRTGSVSIPTSIWRNGHNYVKIMVSSSALGIVETNYVDWVYDPQAADGNSAYSFSSPSAVSFLTQGQKVLSGVKYYTTASYTFNTTVTNFYKNVYSQQDDGGRVFVDLTPGLTASAFTSTPAPANNNSTLVCNSLHTFKNGRLLGETVTSTLRIENGLSKTGSVDLTTGTILLDNIYIENGEKIENFCLEDYRIPSASYDTQDSLNGVIFDSASPLSASDLAVYGGKLLYPTQMLNGGDITNAIIDYAISDQPDYSSATEERYYFRKFINNGNSLGFFTIKLNGKNIDFEKSTEVLSGNKIHLQIKVPEKSGWRDIVLPVPRDTSLTKFDDNVGALESTHPDNIGNTEEERIIKVNLATETIDPTQVFIIRIKASSSWQGYVNKIEIV